MRWVCPYCGELFGNARKRRTPTTCGSTECVRLRKNERMREYLREQSRIYRERGENYRGRWKYSTTRYTRAELRARGCGDRLYKDDLLRRARKRGADAEPFRPREVFERDGWMCGICREPVNRELRYPDPYSPSLDHIVPLSRGGSHTPANAQLAHLTCNLRKGSRLVTEAVS